MVWAALCVMLNREVTRIQLQNMDWTHCQQAIGDLRKQKNVDQAQRWL